MLGLGINLLPTAFAAGAIIGPNISFALLTLPKESFKEAFIDLGEYYKQLFHGCLFDFPCFIVVPIPFCK